MGGVRKMEKDDDGPSSELLEREKGPDVSLEDPGGVLGPDPELGGVRGVRGGGLVEDLCKGKRKR